MNNSEKMITPATRAPRFWVPASATRPKPPSLSNVFLTLAGSRLPSSSVWGARTRSSPAQSMARRLIDLLICYASFSLGYCVGAASVSAALALSMLVAAAVQPLIGILLDRFGGRLVVSIGLGFAGFALCGTALANAFWQVVLLMGLATSIGYAALSPVSATTIVSLRSRCWK